MNDAIALSELALEQKGSHHAKLIWIQNGFKPSLLRDSEKREVDFVVLKNRRPVFAVECKSGGKPARPRYEKPCVDASDSLTGFC